MKRTAKDRQTLLDKALEHGGSVETAMALAISSGMSLTEQLEDGAGVEIPERLEASEDKIVRNYRAYGIEPATEASAEDMTACPYGGIGYMGIEIDFEVS